jgi:type IV pilus assembly protein PilA
LLKRKDEGFTLIELMVVVLIIGILIAIAIPTFLGARKRADDRAAQSSLRNTLTAAKTIFTDNETFNPATGDKADATGLAAGEPSLTFVAAGADSTGPSTVSVDPGAAGSQTFYAAGWSKAGVCWAIKDVEAAPNGGATWAHLNVASPGTGCNATAMEAQTFAPGP